LNLNGNLFFFFAGVIGPIDLIKSSFSLDIAEVTVVLLGGGCLGNLQ